MAKAGRILGKRNYGVCVCVCVCCVVLCCAVLCCVVLCYVVLCVVLCCVVCARARRGIEDIFLLNLNVLH